MDVTQVQDDATSLDSEEDPFERAEWPPGYTRPRRGWLGSTIYKMLAPMPEGLRIRLDEEDPQVRDYKWQAGATLVGAITFLLVSLHFFPQLAISPLSLTATVIDKMGMNEWVAMVAVMAIMWSFLLTAFNSNESTYGTSGGGFWAKAAAKEELWFRAGAENWTMWQRVKSCVAFGLVHVVNLIYPLTSIVVLMAVGGIFMAVYLRAYRRTGNTQVATHESARFHATYNRFAILYFLVAISYSLSSSFFFS